MVPGKQEKKVFRATGIPLRTSFLDLWQQIELAEPLPASFARLYSLHLQKLSNPASAFPPPTPTSRQALKCGTVVIDGDSDRKVKVDEVEAELALQVSEWLQLDEIESLVLVRGVMKKGEEFKEGNKVEVELLERLLMAWAEERLALILIIQNILRHADDADSDLNEWADSLLGEFLVPSTYP
ncbi:hypothetical protein BT69DRAFT_1306001, partial [Atractiella rhizophila]